MGRYRFSMYWYLQLGLNIRYEYKNIVIDIPFVQAHICFEKEAKGTNF